MWAGAGMQEQNHISCSHSTNFLKMGPAFSKGMSLGSLSTLWQTGFCSASVKWGNLFNTWYIIEAPKVWLQNLSNNHVVAFMKIQVNERWTLGSWHPDLGINFFFGCLGSCGMWDLPLQCSDPLVLALTFSCSMAWGIWVPQGSNLRPLHCKVDS